MGTTLSDVPESLLEQLAAELNAMEMLRPDDVTIPRLMNLTGKARSFVVRLMQKKVKDGELYPVKCHDPEAGMNVVAYRKPVV